MTPSGHDAAEGPPPSGPARTRERFATNLRRQRERAGISQERLALGCGLHRTEISLLERGRRDPRLSTIVRLADCLGVPPSALLDDVE